MGNRVWVGLAVLFVLLVCNTADACTIEVDVEGDYVAKSGDQSDYLPLTFEVTGTTEGKIYLESSNGGGEVRFRDEGYNIVTWLDVADRNKNFWVEGITESSAAADVTVTATLKDTDENTLDTKTDTVTVVKVDKVQYQSGANWVDISGTLYVMQGTTVTFKAIPAPAAASWPNGKPVWGGTAGATGTGSTKAVTFNTKSSNTTDFKTVTAKCGNTVTVNVIVYELTGYHVAVNYFPGRATTTYGVAEVVNLYFTVNPTGVTAGQMGNLLWSKVAGEGTIDNWGLTGLGTYTAPATNSNVTLRLTVKSGPSKDRYVDMAFTVTKPTGGRCVKRAASNIWHVINTFSIGVNTDFYLDPKDVSFSRIKFKEGSCNAVTTGWFTDPAGCQGLNHPAWGTWFSVGTGNITNGCKVNRPNGDYAYGSLNPTPLPYTPGTFKWSLPWLYTTDNGTTSHQITTIDHDHTVAANGDATVKKDNTPTYQNNHSNASQGW